MCKTEDEGQMLTNLVVVVGVREKEMEDGKWRERGVKGSV